MNRTQQDLGFVPGKPQSLTCTQDGPLPLSRIHTTGSVSQDLDCDADSAIPSEPGPTASSTPYNWSNVLASEGDRVSQEEVEINRVILRQLKDNVAPQQEVLASILDDHLERVAHADVWVLCTVSIAQQLGVVDDVVTSHRQEMVHGCIERALPKRLRLNKERAETFLKDNWGGWDVCRLPMEYTPAIVVELAKLCRLGVTKENAKTLLQEQIHKRRISKTFGLHKGPTLRKIDITNAIAQMTVELQDLGSRRQSDGSSKSKKRKRVEDCAYSGRRGKRPGLQVDTSSNTSNTSVKNILDTAEAESEVEVGRGGTDNLSDIQGPASYSSYSPEDRHSTAPSSFPVTPSPRSKSYPFSPQFKLRSISSLAKSSLGDAFSGDQSSNDVFEDSFAPDRPPVKNDDSDLDLCRNGQSHHLNLSPPTSKEYIQQDTVYPELDEQIPKQASTSRQLSPVSTQALQDLKDGQRINASVVNAVLKKIISIPGTLLIDSSELAKFDSTSQWNAHSVNSTDPVELSAPRDNRRGKALSASRLIMPFHHPHKEHWSLFVASRREEAYAIEHYDSLRHEGQGAFPDANQTVMRYLCWLVAGREKGVQIISKVRAPCEAAET